MRFVSTAGQAPVVDLPTAVFRGLAPDGGLYIPEELEPLSPDRVEAMRSQSFPEIARVVLAHLLRGAVDEDILAHAVDRALDFPVPVVEVAPGRWALELFHGPTLAFKDVGARVLARLIAALTTVKGRSGPVTILVATSGDTGGAVADAFHGQPGVRVVVLFPRDRVSRVQELQFSTLGDNVQALEVAGSFDDCQRLVKEAFRDRELSARHGLTSANSINLGRLLAQATYYFHAWARLPAEAAGPVYSVPSGNFGNLAAGLLAKRVGLPASLFLAATNENDVVPRYLKTGRFEPRESVPTLATAMDVGDPSNLRRIRSLYGDDVDQLRRDVEGISVDDDRIRDAMARVYHGHGYLLDPHSAVAWVGLEEAGAGSPASPGVFLATAHPAKFADVVGPAVGDAVPCPPQLARALEGDRNVLRIAPRIADVVEVLRDHVPG